MVKITYFFFFFQLKLEDYFHEYDPLRKGSVNASDFQKALKKAFRDLLTDGQVEEIQRNYVVEGSDDCYNWPKFLHDAETGTIYAHGVLNNNI